MNRIWNILFWSVLSAAFIGPGTVTTAASAGAGFGARLLWALGFSTLACIVLQEGAARLTAVSGQSLGPAILDRFGTGAARTVAGGVTLGCMAYQAGNILGAVAGLEMLTPLNPRVGTILVGAICAVLLATASTRWVARLLGILVALMGITFVATAIRVGLDPGQVLRSATVPSVPTGSLALIVGLIGTTVVPYNLFLGSGLARGHDLGPMRVGILVSVALGGLVSMAVLVAGTAVDGPFSFEALAQVLDDRLGAGPVVGFGLFAAGLSSAITAPLAAALTVGSVFPSSSSAWEKRTWMATLAVGLVFGLTGIKPIPMILTAQLFNGLLLPLVVTFLLLALNREETLRAHRNGPWTNAAGLLVWTVALVLGVASLLRGAASVLGLDAPAVNTILAVGGLSAGVGLVPLVLQLRRARS